MTYTLVKHFWISCAHYVTGSGRCAQLHGHNYKVVFCVSGQQLDEIDMLIDFRDVKHAIERKFDHHLLNDFPEFKPEEGGYLPTTERVAEVFFNIIHMLCQEKTNQPTLNWVEIHETNEAYTRYEL